MVFTRSKLRNAFGYVNVIYNTELDRIRLEYAEDEVDDQDVEDVVVKNTTTNTTHPTLFSVEIDFDDAHDAWMANKKRKANGDYAYLCSAPLKTGKTCKRYCSDKIGLYSGCRTHYSWEETAHKSLVL